MSFPRWFIYSLIIMLVIPLLTGCSVGTVIAHGTDFAVSRYCDVPKGARSLVRKKVAEKIAPNSIQINCQ